VNCSQAQREATSTTSFPAGAPTFFYLFDQCAPGNVYSLNGQKSSRPLFTASRDTGGHCRNSYNSAICTDRREVEPMQHRPVTAFLFHIRKLLGRLSPRITKSTNLRTSSTELLSSHERDAGSELPLIRANRARSERTILLTHSDRTWQSSFAYPESRRL